MPLDCLALLRSVRAVDRFASPMAEMIGVRCILAVLGEVAATLDHWVWRINWSDR